MEKAERTGRGGMGGTWLGLTGSRFCGEDRYKVVPGQSSVSWNCVGMGSLKPGQLVLWLASAWPSNAFSGLSCRIFLELQRALALSAFIWQVRQWRLRNIK